MQLAPDEREILAGGRGPVLQKALQTLVEYGQVFGADRFVPISSSHFVMSCGLNCLPSMFDILGRIKAAGLRAAVPLTANPRPMDADLYPLKAKLIGKWLYSGQERLESLLGAIGLIDAQAFTCTPYLPGLGNRPSAGDVLGWAESSAVVFANSVLGARTNRNSAMIELFSALLGRTPRFGLLLEENRRADWVIEVKTKERPNPHLLGALVGRTCLETVPFLTGLDAWAYDEDDLKDMGAASASNGAVGLFHVENVTPEARELGTALVKPGARRLTVDDRALADLRESFAPLPRRPQLALIGCPHLSARQLAQWAERLAGRRLAVKTWFACAPAVARAFKETPAYEAFRRAGARLTSICGLMFANNPGAHRIRLITNSAKLRYYTFARFGTDEEILAAILGGAKEETA